MSYLRKNLSWIAPTVATVAVAAGFLHPMNAFSPFYADQGAKTEKDDPSGVDLLNASVQAALTTAVQPVDGQGNMPETVTRNAPVDLLQVAPAPEVEPVAAQPAPLPAIDTESAAAFFNDAQSRLAVANACGEDLKTLAAQARIYFPTGAASGEEAGLNAARLIGIVARDCPGYSVQVEGHSDASGDPVTNQKLSEKRAQAVIARLGASGIDTSNFFAVGFGDTRPSGVSGPKGQAYYDRRVEFSVVETVQQVRFSPTVQPWAGNVPSCMRELDGKAQQMRQFYAPGAITVSTNEMDAIYALVADVARCEGARLRLVGQHEDAPGSREGPATGRLRALAMMSTLVSAGYPSDQILIGAPSRSIDVPGQPGLPNSRIDFQVIAD